MNRSALPLVFLLTLTAACNDDHGIGVECPTAGPLIKSMDFDSSRVSAGDVVTATVVVRNFELSGESGQTHTESEDAYDLGPGTDTLDSEAVAEECVGGHVHIYLDDLMTNPLTQAVERTFMFSIPDDATLGAHEIIGRLHNRDHTIFEPQVFITTDITVE